MLRERGNGVEGRRLKHLRQSRYILLLLLPFKSPFLRLYDAPRRAYRGKGGLGVRVVVETEPSRAIKLLPERRSSNPAKLRFTTWKRRETGGGWPPRKSTCPPWISPESLQQIREVFEVFEGGGGVDTGSIESHRFSE